MFRGAISPLMFTPRRMLLLMIIFAIADAGLCCATPLMPRDMLT